MKSEEKRKERATLTMNAWFPGGAIQAIIGNIDPLCGEAESFRRLLCEEYLKMQAPNVAKLKRSIHGSRLLPPSSLLPARPLQRAPTDEATLKARFPAVSMKRKQTECV